MERIYEEILGLIKENYQQIKADFKWDQDLVKHMVALAYGLENKKVDVEAIKEVHDHIKDRTGAFSNFRGTMHLALSGLLALEGQEAQNCFDLMLTLQPKMKEVGLKQSTYQPIALYTLIKYREDKDLLEVLKKSKEVYDSMKASHPFLTGGDDYALAIILAASEIDMDRIELYYNRLGENGFRKTNGLQMLSHILSLGDIEEGEAIRRCDEIMEALRIHKLKLSSEYYPAVGLIAILPESIEQLMDQLTEIANDLRATKGYKWLGKGMNVMMASSIIASRYTSNKDMETTTNAAIGVSIQAIIAAQQAAMIAAISASTAATAASS